MSDIRVEPQPIAFRSDGVDAATPPSGPRSVVDARRLCAYCTVNSTFMPFL